VEKHDFIKTLWGALEPARKAGFNMRALLAQIAMETGWLEHVNKFGSGLSTFNLFNITAGQHWTGPVCQVPTHEVIHGKRVSMTRPFRAYPSYEASVRDYLDLIQKPGRYEKAWANRGDQELYPGELQKAGYATDPTYAMKIIQTARALPPLPGEEA
jgi:peptidoglycan hydrolase FlgJ